MAAAVGTALVTAAVGAIVAWPGRSPAAGGPPAFAGAPCWQEPLSGFTERCGWVSVPERHDEPGGPTIRLAVAILATPATDASAEPTILLGGGPGEPVIDTFVGVFRRIEELGRGAPPVDEDERARLDDALAALAGWRESVARRPLVVFDQRGAGHSEPSLDCPDPDPARCRATLVARGIDLSAYTTSASADDVDDIRAALGVEHVTLDGGSYGTRLGLEVLRRHGDAVRAAVFEGVAPPQVRVFSDRVRRYDASLAVLFELCGADEACAGAYPHLTDAFYAAVAQRDDRPLQVTVGGSSRPMTGQDLRRLVWQGLFERDPVRWLPRLIVAFGEGDADFVGRFVGRADPFPSEGLSEGMSWSVECSGATGADSVAAVASAAMALRAEIREAVANDATGSLGICDTWGNRGADPGSDAPVTSDVPVLLLSGQLDPGTPAEYADLAARTLDSATSVVLPGLGHTDGYFTACGARLHATFLDDPGAPLDLSCVDAMPPVEFEDPDAQPTW